MGLFCNIELLPKIKSFLELPIFSPVMTHNRQGGHFCLRYYQYVVLLVGWYVRQADLKFRLVHSAVDENTFGQILLPIGTNAFYKRDNSFLRHQWSHVIWAVGWYHKLLHFDFKFRQIYLAVEKNTFSYLDKYTFQT